MVRPDSLYPSPPASLRWHSKLQEQSFSQKRSWSSIDGLSSDMLEPPRLKRARQPPAQLDSFTPQEQQALEYTAALLQRPMSQLLNDPHRPPKDPSESSQTRHGEAKPLPSRQSPTFLQQEATRPWQSRTSGAEASSYIPTELGTRSQRPTASIGAEGPSIDLELNVYIGGHHRFGLGDHDSEPEPFHSSVSEVGYTESWFQDGNPDEISPWSDMQIGFQPPDPVDFGFTHFRDMHYTSPLATNPPDVQFSQNVIDVSPYGMPTTESSNELGFTLLRDPSDTDDSAQALEFDQWEKIEVPGASHAESQLSTSAATSNSEWSLLEIPPAHELIEESSRPSSFEWVPAGSDTTPSISKPQRRGPFQDIQLRQETSNTRKLKACVRCKMQKIRCQTDDNDPSGICKTCKFVSKQKIHTLPCLRYKITECTLFRTGKAPGMEFTFRWPEMKLRDISKWADTKTRIISVVSDVCDVPLEFSVRRFIPIPQDALYRGWMEGRVKKWKEVTPFAIVNMSSAAKDMREHINTHTFRCMEFFLRGKDSKPNELLVYETYAFARGYMLRAPEDEAALLGEFFRLWFAIRRTATFEHIVGKDTLDMTPEETVPLPPVMIQQLDMILTLGFLNPLRKKVLEHFQRIVVNNKPKSWMTIYLITFMFLHSCSALSAENFNSASKHGLLRRYAMPNFISELHHGVNVFLSYYHYCTKPCNPFKLNWKRRQSNPFREMGTNDIHFLKMTCEWLKERKNKIRVISETELYEDDLYFVSQMFEDDWQPRDTEITYGDETVGDVPLRRSFGIKK